MISILFALGLAGCVQLESDRAGGEEKFLSEISDLEALELEAGQKIQVIASTILVFETLDRVGAGGIELQLLIPRGADPHAYEPLPSDLRKLTQADLVFLSGVGLETALHTTLEEIAEQVPILSLSEGLSLRSFGVPEGVADEHEGASYDPHVWLDPLNVAAWAENAARALAAVDPSHAESYRHNAADYVGELRSLHEWIRMRTASIPAEQRKLVTDHVALGYFAARYDFTLVGAVIPAYSTAAEPSARELANLVDTIERESVTAIFVSSNANPKLAERIGRDTAAQIIPLYIGTLTAPGGPAGTYIDMMKYNVRAIVAGLSGK